MVYFSTLYYLKQEEQKGKKNENSKIGWVLSIIILFHNIRNLQQRELSCCKSLLESLLLKSITSIINLVNVYYVKHQLKAICFIHVLIMLFIHFLYPLSLTISIIAVRKPSFVTLDGVSITLLEKDFAENLIESYTYQTLFVKQNENSILMTSSKTFYFHDFIIVLWWHRNFAWSE